MKMLSINAFWQKLRNIAQYKIVWVILGIIFVQFIFWPCFGSYDMFSFIDLADTLRQYGLQAGYAHYNLYYPPLSSVIIYPAAKLINFHSANYLLQALPIKLALALVYYFTFALLLLYLRKNHNSWLAALEQSKFFLLNIALLEATLILSYFDILLAPSLFLCFYFTQQKKYFFSGLFLAVAFMTKIIPILIIPAFLVYFFTKLPKQKIKIDLKSCSLFILGLSVIVIPLVYYFGYAEVKQIFIISNGHGTALSYAYNLNRVISDLLHTNSTPGFVYILNKGLFFLISGCLLLKLFVSKKNIELLLLVCLGIFFTYFLFWSGVHENHIFPALLVSMALLLVNASKLNKKIYYLTTLICFVNLALPYGLGYWYFEGGTRGYIGIRGYLWSFISDANFTHIYSLISAVSIIIFCYLFYKIIFYRQVNA